MAKGGRVPERVYTGVLWVVSLVFAGFIIGLGDLVIGDLPQVEQHVVPEQYGQTPDQARIASQLQANKAQIGAIDDRKQILSLQLDQAQKASQTGNETFQAWISARTATTNPQQDPEVLQRTRALEQLKANERAVQSSIDALDNQKAPLEQQQTALQAAENKADADAAPQRERAEFAAELRVFLLRLAITLPMLAVGGWLVLKKRKSDYWPLMRGFVLAAVFVFFVELVPYLPSYGGYVRYVVGIVLTIIAGHFLIKNMRAYLEKRQQVEAQAEDERRKLVSHDEAFKKMAAKVCPGCDRPIGGMEGVDSNFCVHCGMTLFDHCGQCSTRKMAFFRYCMSCGTPAGEAGAAA